MKESYEDRSKEHNQEIGELIDVLHAVHVDNSQLQYFAEKYSGNRISIMPVTPFIYEFFLFNSLYQIDWETTQTEGKISYYQEEECGETKKQRRFLSFLKIRAEKFPENIYRAFEPFIYIDTEGTWSIVNPDARITEALGKKFFNDIGRLKSLLSECRTPADMPSSKKTFDILNNCTYFIYLVRNNIFHGSKGLNEVYESNQKRRIEIYDLFLKSLTSLFFLLSGKNKAACDYVPCPLYVSTKHSNGPIEIMDQQLILRATRLGMMKIGDSRIVGRFLKLVQPPITVSHLSDRSSLFYPSAGTDFITPILLGLPFCTQFYFFELGRRRRPSASELNRRRLPSLAGILRNIKGGRFLEGTQWIEHDDTDCLDFEFDNVPRRIHWVHADNTEILKKNIELRFYFHRGDSEGEGGSGQRWDSTLLPELIKLIPSGSSAIYVTDGQPGGFNPVKPFETFALDLPFIERGRTYYCGRLPSSSPEA